MSIRLLSCSFLTMMLSLIVACKKDNMFGTDQNVKMTPLTGDTAVIIGIWEWTYSDHVYGWCEGDQFTEMVIPSTAGFSFSIRFIEQGLVYLYKNDSLISEHRIVFRQFSTESSTCGAGTGYHIYLDGLEEKWMSGCIDDDTLMRTSFIGFSLQEQVECGYYNNFFVKQ